ncbi:MAG: trypsin-like serine peptidase [Salibacteraceae bacterium]
MAIDFFQLKEQYKEELKLPALDGAVPDEAYMEKGEAVHQAALNDPRSRKGRYGDWSVINVRNTRSRTIKHQAKAVFGIVSKRYLNPFHGYAVDRYRRSFEQIVNDCDFHYKGIPLDPDFQLGRYPTLAMGTAFAVAPNLALTAGHNVGGRYLDWYGKQQFLDPSDFRLLREFRLGKKWQREDIRSFSVIKRVKKMSQDWALLRVDGAPFEHYLDLELDPKALVFQKPGKYSVYGLGHPLGLPQKLFHEAKMLWDRDTYNFTCNVDAFSGNSGSPIICGPTDRVIGILYRGQPDFVVRDGYWKLNTMKTTKEAEIVFKVCSLPEDIQQTILSER